MNNNSFDESKFYLGVLCKRGHDYQESGKSLKYVKSKACVECYKFRSKHDFKYIQSAAESSRRYRKSERGKESAAAYRKSEARKQVLKKYHSSEKRKLALRRYCATEKFRVNTQRYRATDKGRLSAIRVSHRRRTRKRQNHLAPYTPEQKQQRVAEFNNCCAYCGVQGKITLDHFIPISKGGPDAIGNLLPSCNTCNVRKSDQNILVWYPRQPFYSKQRWKKILAVLGKTKATINQLPLF